ncbi:MAG TPA: hypothetical protein VFE53_22265 [Mucilaginibacter sp.]|nr:hypothetical protein [Mucilaginibacter sp.]
MSLYFFTRIAAALLPPKLKRGRSGAAKTGLVNPADISANATRFHLLKAIQFRIGHATKHPQNAFETTANDIGNYYRRPKNVHF